MSARYWVCIVVRQLILARTLTVGESDGEGEELVLHYELEEELPRGTRVGSIFDDARLRDSFDRNVLRSIRFRFLADSHDLFDLAEATGIVSTAVEIDRDGPTICRQRETCELSLDVVLQPIQYFQVIKVVVRLLDINDNAPQFREPHSYLPIVEAAQVGSVYIIPTATDYDSPVNGIQNYELDSLSSKFGLQITTKIDGTLEVRLVLQEKLDRETEAEYHLKLMAVDGGTSPPRVGTCSITVTVLDSNDNKPRFSRQQYRVNVPENVAVGQTIARVEADDADAGANGLVRYSFSHQTQQALGQTFGIRNDTGEIFVRGGVDHERAAIHVLVVVARDGGQEPFSSEASVIVTVEDTNDNAPSVTINTLSSVAGWGSGGGTGTLSTPIAEVPENATEGTFVAHVTAMDSDSGDNGRVNCTLSDSVFRLVRKFATEYQIVTASALDRERIEEYTVAVKCQDNAAVAARVTEKTLRVVVGDINDCAPVFSQAVYYGSLVENNFIGTSVMQVTATDRDDADNARIQYSIPGKVSGLFHVDQRGVISAHSSIDREKYDNFRFPVLAVDLGSPPKTGSALVSINVEDVDDEDSRFVQPSYVFSVHENEPAGTKVGTVTAEDRDGPALNTVSYALPPSAAAAASAEDAPFVVDQDSGVITTARPLDRELQGLHTFSVVAFDPKAKSGTSTAVVSVNVLDRNDNGPVFHFPSRSNDTVFVSNLLPVGHVVAEVVAQDADLENNRRLSFRLVGERSDRGMFRIDPNRGSVLVNSKLTSIDYQTFRLTVLASDHGSPPRAQTAELKIHVNRTIPVSYSSSSSSSGNEDGGGGGGLFSWNSTYSTVALIVIVASAFVFVTVVVVSVFLLREREKRRRTRKQNSRMKALRMLTNKDHDAQVYSSPELSPVKKLVNGDQIRPNGDNLTDEDASVVVCCPSSRETSAFVGGLRPWSSATTYFSQNDVLLQNIPSILKSNSLPRGGAGPPLDPTSDYSFDGSTTDSDRERVALGRDIYGNEEEEEDEDEEEEEEDGRNQRRTISKRNLPPPPPPPRGSFWLQQQQRLPHHHLAHPHHHHHHHNQRRGHNHPTVRFRELRSSTKDDDDDDDDDDDFGGRLNPIGEGSSSSPPPPTHRHRLIDRLTGGTRDRDFAPYDGATAAASAGAKGSDCPPPSLLLLNHRKRTGGGCCFLRSGGAAAAPDAEPPGAPGLRDREEGTGEGAPQSSRQRNGGLLSAKLDRHVNFIRTTAAAVVKETETMATDGGVDDASVNARDFVK